MNITKTIELMKKWITYLSLIIGLFVTIGTLTACGGSEDDDYDISKAYYYLYYGVDNDLEPNVNWTVTYDPNDPFLRLEFSESIPKGSDWYLECDASWVNLRNTHGRVSQTIERIPITIEDNTNYDDREAYIYLNVPDGKPMSTTYTTVTIRQYGYNTHLSRGKYVSFTTNRSKAESSRLTIENIRVGQIMEVDWGDGSKEIYTRKDPQSGQLSISHEYKSNKNYTVKLRFAPNEDGLNFNFRLNKGQGIEQLDCHKGNSTPYDILNSQTVLVSYSENNGYNVTIR